MLFEGKRDETYAVLEQVLANDEVIIYVPHQLNPR